MSSSFVKDCSDVSASGNSSSGKTVIIIVNNETGNVSLDQCELQNLLASHGADGSQVSVVRMGSGGVGGVVGSASDVVSNPALLATADGTTHVNFTVEGFPGIPLEGHVNAGMNYAELPLDQESFQRLESVLESEEAREILGEPLLDMVANPDNLGPLDQLMDPSLFGGADQENLNNQDHGLGAGHSASKKTRSPPKRRSQRQMDKAEREEVEKIRAENNKLLQEEKQQLSEQQLLEKMMQKMDTIDEVEENGEEEMKEESEEEEEEEDEEEEDKEDPEVDEGAVTKGKVGKKGITTKKEAKVGKGRGVGKSKGKEKPQDTKGKGKGKKKMEEEEPEVGVGRSRARARGSAKEVEVGGGGAKGKGRGIVKKEAAAEAGVPGKAHEKNAPAAGKKKKGESETDASKAKSQKLPKNVDTQETEEKSSRDKSGNKKSPKENQKESATSSVNTNTKGTEKKTVNLRNRKDSQSEGDKKLPKGIKGKEGSDGDETQMEVDAVVENKIENESEKKSKLRKNTRNRDSASDNGAHLNEVDSDNKIQMKSQVTLTGKKLVTIKKGVPESNAQKEKEEELEEEKGKPKSEGKTQPKRGKKAESNNAKTPPPEQEAIASSTSDDKEVGREEIRSSEETGKTEGMEVDPRSSSDEDVSSTKLYSKDLPIKSFRVTVDKIDVQAAIEREMSKMDMKSDNVESKKEPKKIENNTDAKVVLDSKAIADLSAEIFGDSDLPEVDSSLKEREAIMATPKVMLNFRPPFSSTPNTLCKEGVSQPSSSEESSTNNRGQKIIVKKKELSPPKGDNEAEAVNERANTGTPTAKSSVVVLKTGVKKEGVLSESKVKELEKELEENAKMSPEKISLEPASKLIQVKSPVGIRQVVVLNSVKSAAANKETLVKVIDPIDPPREEDRLTVAQICANAKKEAAQKKKLEQRRRKNSEGDHEFLEPKAKSGAASGAQNKTQKGKGKVESKPLKVEPQKKELPVVAPKIVDLEMKMEDSVQLKKREAQRRREEIQRNREELTKKREAIKLRKEQQLKEMQQMKKEENTEQVEQETKPIEKPVQKGKLIIMSAKAAAASEPLKRTNSQEQQAKRDVKVAVQSNKVRAPQKIESVETPVKSKGQMSSVKSPVSETPPKNQAKSSLAKKIASPQGAGKKGTAATKGIASAKKANQSPKPVTIEESPVRRSGRAIKKKTFGDEMVTFDLKESVVPEPEEAIESDVEPVSEAEEDTESLDDYDDPERLWCICQKPHNNRFMICCDRCEDWFHGTCVGITKAMGQQMEDEGVEWVCPKCKKAEKALKSTGTSMSMSQKKDLIPIVTSLPRKAKAETKSEAVAKPEAKKSLTAVSKKEAQTSQQGSKRVTSSEMKRQDLIVSPKNNKDAIGDDGGGGGGDDEQLPTSTSSLKKVEEKDTKDLEEHQIPGVTASAVKSEPRVLVFEKATGKILSGSEAPSLREVKTWLKDHPEYAILHPGMMKTPGALVKAVKTDVGSLTKPNTQGANKVIHLSTSPAVSSTKGSPQKLTVVKSADGRIIVKTSEAVDKTLVNKIVSSSSGPSATKTGAGGGSAPVTIPKPVVVSTKSILKDPEFKVTESSSKVLEPIAEDDEETDSDEELPSLKKNMIANHLKKSNEASPIKRSIEITPPKVDVPPKNVDSVSMATAEVPAKPADTVPKISSPVKDMKKTPLKPAVVEKKAADPSVVRNSVKNTLADCLIKRSKEAINEFEDLTEEDIHELAQEIERELFLFFSKDVGFKYKSRYRSLLFNIRDAKNSGLFRKILNGTISPSNLAKMTSEELASKELAEWREREEKKELQAIEKYELDMISLGNQYIMKSHKGEIEIDKDEFIKDKEKAPETINALPADPVTGLLEDTTSGHKNHLYDLNCKICTGKQDSTVSQDLKSKGKSQDRKDHRDDKKSDSSKVKERRESKSSSSSKDRDRHHHRSKDHEKDRSRKHKRDRSRERDKEDRSKSKEGGGRDRKESEKERYSKEKHRDRKDSERERERHKSSSDKKERRDSKEDKDRKHKSRRERHSSKEDKDRRKDSDAKDRKRRHSESRSDDRKRRDSEKSRQRDADSAMTDFDSDRLEREKAVVSTSEDVVIDLQRLRRESFSNLDPEAKDSVPTSTVMGSPDIVELRDEGYPPSMCSANPQDYPYGGAPLPGEEAPTPPPLPSSPPEPPYIDIPATPPLPDSPSTPPLPDSLEDSPRTPSLPEEICLSDDDDDFPNTPPLPDDDDDDAPATPPLPSEMDNSLDAFDDRPSTPPLPISRSSLSLLPSSSSDKKDRLTPRLGTSLSGGGISSSPVPTKPAEPVIVWKGAIHMSEVAKFHASAFEVSGKACFLPDDLPKVLEVVGRISPDTVWSYIAQTKKAGSREILVVRFQPSNEEEKVSYIALYSYLSSKKRYGVLDRCDKAYKDFYVVPLASHQPIPQVLLPLDGPGFEEHRAHMLIGVIIRTKQRRIYDHITGSWQIVGGSSSIPHSNPLHKNAESADRSYTPPLPSDQEPEEIPLDSSDSEDNSKSKERLTPPLNKREAEDSEEFHVPGTFKRQAKNPPDLEQPKKRPSLDRRLQEVAEMSLDPKSPAEFSFADGTLDQESMLAELNRQIEVHKKELSEMQKTVLNEEEEPYSPSMSNNASPGEEPLKLDTSKINIPSNLQEILNNIKEKEMEIKNKEQEIKRRLNLAADPIVMNYSKIEETERKSRSEEKPLPPPPPPPPPPADVDMRPVLQQKPKEVKQHKEDVDLRILQGRDPKEQPQDGDAFGSNNDDTDLRVRDPRLARAHAAAVMEAIEKGKTLGTLTDEELLAKALEMEGQENAKHLQGNSEMEHTVFQPVPPPPFMSSGGPSNFMPQPGPPMGPANAMPPGMVGMPYMNQVGQPSQSMPMYGPPGGRDQGPGQGPPCMPGPPHSMHDSGSVGPGPLGPPHPNPVGPPCGPPMHDGPGFPDHGPGPMEPPSRYGESSRYPEEGPWDRNYSNRDWDYNYDHYPDDDYRNKDHYREDNYRESDYYRDRDRNRDWHRRKDRDSGYERHSYKRKRQYDSSRSGGGGGGGSDFDRRRSKQFGSGKNEESGDHERRREGRGGSEDSHTKSNSNKERKRDRYREKVRKLEKFKSLHRKPEDDDECRYEIDY